MRKFLYGLAIVGSLILLAPYSVAGDDAQPPGDRKSDFPVPDFGIEYVSYVEGRGPVIQHVWHKIHFDQPQKSSSGMYSRMVVLIEIDCVKNTVALLRKLEYAADGSLLSDTKTPKDRLLRENFYGSNPADPSDAAIRKAALTDDDDVCPRGD